MLSMKSLEAIGDLCDNYFARDFVILGGVVGVLV